VVVLCQIDDYPDRQGREDYDAYLREVGPSRLIVHQQIQNVETVVWSSMKPVQEPCEVNDTGYQCDVQPSNAPDDSRYLRKELGSVHDLRG
jgi:hypothetical protein